MEKIAGLTMGTKSFLTKTNVPYAAVSAIPLHNTQLINRVFFFNFYLTALLEFQLYNRQLFHYDFLRFSIIADDDDSRIT